MLEKLFSTMNVQHEYMDEDGRFDPRSAAVWQSVRELGTITSMAWGA